MICILLVDSQFNMFTLAITFPGFSSDSDLVSLTVDVDSPAELDDGMASNQSSPIRTFGLSLSSDPSALGAVASDSEPNKTEEERENRSLFPGSLKSKLGKRDYLEKAGELIKLALKKEEEDDYEAASDFYRKGVDLLLEGVQGTVLSVLICFLCWYLEKKYMHTSISYVIVLHRNRLKR